MGRDGGQPGTGQCPGHVRSAARLAAAGLRRSGRTGNGEAPPRAHRARPPDLAPIHTQCRCAGVLADDEAGHLILMAGAVAMAALVVLAGRLPGHAEPGGDLRPPDAQADTVVDEHREPTTTRARSGSTR